MIFLTNPADETIRDLFEEHAEDLDQYGLEPKVERIANESYPGFIPYTNGGWSVMVMDDLGQVNGSGRYYAAGPQADLDKAIEYSLDMALESFIESNMDAMERIYGTRDEEKLKEVVSYHDLYDHEEGELAEELSEMESDSMTEGGEFWAVLRASYFAADNSRSETGEDEIFFYSGVNTDYTYGRDKGLITTFERTVKVSDLPNIDLAALVQEMRDSMFPAKED